MITDEEIEKAINWLRDKAEEAGQIAAHREYMDEWIKVEKANVAELFVGVSNAEAERQALAHPRYKQALEARKEATAADVQMRWLTTAAEAKIEAWRTQQSNQRALGKL